MRTLAMFLLLVGATPAWARSVESSKVQVPVARVVEVVKLVDKPHILVSLVVEDTGGSTDVSPTQRLYFTVYMKGEMFSTDAAFDLGPIFGLQKSRRRSGGVYEVTLAPDFTLAPPRAPVWTIDARDAIVAMKKVSCEDFDCEASTRFAATIEVTTSTSPRGHSSPGRPAPKR
ncbi:MAG: hypothetical protein AAFU79_01125 [Myxococcota bacterium]